MCAEQRSITLKINEDYTQTPCYDSDLLLHVLRNRLGLTGTKSGCLNGDCGTCTVHIDGIPMKSCLMLAVEAVGTSIMTIEGLHSPLQKAFIDHNAFQCGYCTPGFIMNIEGLIRMKPHANEQDIEDWLQSNICRCTSYEEIKAATLSVLKGQNQEEGTSLTKSKED